MGLLVEELSLIGSKRALLESSNISVIDLETPFQGFQGNYIPSSKCTTHEIKLSLPKQNPLSNPFVLEGRRLSRDTV
jgi:hypothetical protein